MRFFSVIGCGYSRFALYKISDFTFSAAKYYIIVWQAVYMLDCSLCRRQQYKIYAAAWVWAGVIKCGWCERVLPTRQPQNSYHQINPSFFFIRYTYISIQSNKHIAVDICSLNVPLRRAALPPASFNVYGNMIWKYFGKMFFVFQVLGIRISDTEIM